MMPHRLLRYYSNFLRVYEKDKKNSNSTSCANSNSTRLFKVLKIPTFPPPVYSGEIVLLRNWRNQKRNFVVAIYQCNFIF